MEKISNAWMAVRDHYFVDSDEMHERRLELIRRGTEWSTATLEFFDQEIAAAATDSEREIIGIQKRWVIQDFTGKPVDDLWASIATYCLYMMYKCQQRGITDIPRSLAHIMDPMRDHFLSCACGKKCMKDTKLYKAYRWAIELKPKHGPE